MATNGGGRYVTERQIVYIGQYQVVSGIPTFLPLQSLRGAVDAHWSHVSVVIQFKESQYFPLKAAWPNSDVIKTFKPVAIQWEMAHVSFGVQFEQTSLWAFCFQQKYSTKNVVLGIKPSELPSGTFKWNCRSAHSVITPSMFDTPLWSSVQSLWNYGNKLWLMLKVNVYSPANHLWCQVSKTRSGTREIKFEIMSLACCQREIKVYKITVEFCVILSHNWIKSECKWWT